MTPMDTDLPRPQLAIYKDCVAAPVGYFYRHYKQRRGPSETPAGRGTDEYKMNSVTIEDPFQSVLAVNKDERRPKVLWDADVIVGSPTSNQVYVYNQPDAIPIACVRTNFGNPLTKRVQQVASGQYCSREANSRIQIPLPHEYLTPFMPRKERPDSPQLLAMQPNQESPSDLPGVTYAATLHDM
ncbi:unnamed protein product [Lymnaea stagnalis]|uniref:Uncharacterized protein n=1 Tax=Lymnaea stagnalis TaxID=6523 RepID=A0AAV2H5S7_LYMST